MADNPSASNSQSPACDDCRKRKIRCDRRSPKCSNCQRSKSACVFTNDGKKANTTRQIADDVAGLNSRLADLDNTNVKLLERIEALAVEVSRSKQPSSPKSLSTGSPVPVEPLSSSDGAKQLAGRKTIGSSVVVFENGFELYFGPTSTRSLFLQAKDQVLSYIQTRQQNLAREKQPSIHEPPAQGHATPPASIAAILPELQRRVEIVTPLMSLPLSDIYKVEQRVEVSPLRLPPKEIVQTSVEIFFEESNLECIIFQKGSVVDAVEQYYHSAGEEDEAWVLALNNIVVLSLCYRSKVMRSTQYILSNIDYDLLASGVEAAKRALSRVDRLEKPRVVNIQALLTLSLVARKFFPSVTFESVFHRACQMAKEMGLPEGLSENLTPMKQEERKNLVWAFYSIDKQLTATKDGPCNLYLFEINLPLIDATGSPDSQRQDSIAAQLRLAMLQEELYKRLSSPQARSQDFAKRQSTIYALNDELDAWWMHHENLLYRYDSSKGKLNVSSLHLRYCFLSLKVLIHRSGKVAASKQTTLRCAIEALKTLQKLCDGNSLIEGGLLAIDRLFRGCSIVNFYEVFENFMNVQQRMEDLDHLKLLIGCTSALGLVALPKYQDSYFVRMHKGLSWCTEIVQLIHNAEMTQTMSVAPFEPLGQSVNCHPGMPYQGSQLQRNPGSQEGSEELSSVTYFTSSPSSGTSSGWTSSLNMSNNSSGTLHNYTSHDSLFGYGGISSTSPPAFGNLYKGHDTAYRPQVGRTGSSLNVASNPAELPLGGLDTMVIDQIGQSGEHMVSSNNDYVEDLELYDDLIKAAAFPG